MNHISKLLFRIFDLEEDYDFSAVYDDENEIISIEKWNSVYAEISMANDYNHEPCYEFVNCELDEYETYSDEDTVYSKVEELVSNLLIEEIN